MGVERRAERLDFVDLMRGFAVVCMIEWHTTDAWIVDSVRSSSAFEALRFIGGLAAPLFLLLAGVSLGIKADGHVRKNVPLVSSLRDMAARGFEVIVFGYALRVYMWAVDASGLFRPSSWSVLVPACAAIAAGLIGAEVVTKRPTRGVLLIIASSVLYGFAVWRVQTVHPEKAPSFLKVDVLQCIGASLIVASIVGRALGAWTRPWRAFLLGLVVTLVTNPITALLPGALPRGLAAYIGKWPLAPGTPTATLFPMFPWLAYVFIGLGLGTLWVRAARENRLARLIYAGAAIGGALALLGAESLPHNGNLAVWFPWLVPFMRVVYRIGIALVLAGVANFVANRIASPNSLLHVFGQTSMFVYLVHMEFAFGIVARALHKALFIPAWFAGFVILVGAMYVLARIRLRLKKSKHEKQTSRESLKGS